MAPELSGGWSRRPPETHEYDRSLSGDPSAGTLSTRVLALALAWAARDGSGIVRES